MSSSRAKGLSLTTLRRLEVEISFGNLLVSLRSYVTYLFTLRGMVNTLTAFMVRSGSLTAVTMKVSVCFAMLCKVLSTGQEMFPARNATDTHAPNFVGE